MNFIFEWKLLNDIHDNKEVIIIAYGEELIKKVKETSVGGTIAEKEAYKNDPQGQLHLIRDTFVHPVKGYKAYVLHAMLL